MNNIDDELLHSLFLLSNLKLNDDEKEEWKKDLEHWINFFRFNDKIVNYNDKLKSVSIGTNSDIRDDKIEPSLNIKDIKSFAPRLLDGFISLAIKERNNRWI